MTEHKIWELFSSGMGKSWNVCLHAKHNLKMMLLIQPTVSVPVQGVMLELSWVGFWKCYNMVSALVDLKPILHFVMRQLCQSCHSPGLCPELICWNPAWSEGCSKVWICLLLVLRLGRKHYSDLSNYPSAAISVGVPSFVQTMWCQVCVWL